ncbi:MAG: EAL domain-containing protein, partial [Clostridia bacterium]
TFKREGDHPDIYRMIEEIPEHGKCMASVQPIDLYNSHTPFEQERWMLIGIMEETSLFGFTHRIIRTIWFVAGIVLLLGVIGAAFTGYRLVRPITALAQALRQSDPHQPVKLEKTHITEIDQLSSAIEHSSYAVADAASRLAHIIEMADIPIGAFEHEAGARTVYCTNSFFKKLQDWPIDTEETFCQVPCEAFDAWLICFRKNKVETIEADGTTIYRVGPSKTTPSRWIRVKTMEKDNVTLGVLVDVTMERMEKQKIEYERDYDLLTNLLNRRAFQQQAERLLENTSEIKTAALVMLDLDNLKYINDTYGHDSGDAYIRCAADAMRSCKNAHTLVARMSGDEFFVFFTGFENRSVARKEIDRLRDGMMGTGLLLPDGERVRVRASAGVAWYPKDAQTLSELIRFADFAMYQVKNTTKGSVQDFDQTLYERDAFLLQSKEDLNRMIEEELVDYAFQPIVDAQTGETFAYEALMRPRPHALCIPLDVLRIARSQAMLYRIERLTWFKAMETYIKHEQEMKRCRIFINSISNQHLDDQDTEIFDQQFEAYLDRIVIELTEGEHADDLCIAEKKLRCRRYDAAIALDDFGTGFNGEVTLLRLVPDYIKMDINIVHGIDHDETRQEIFRNLVLFSKQRNIKVVAEGVENEAEMRTLVELGVDYMQGFFFGKPQLEPQHAILEAVETLLRVRRKIEQANGCE